MSVSSRWLAPAMNSLGETHAMREQISSFSDERAQQAVLLLFDLVPAESWQGGKPTLGQVDGLVERIMNAEPTLRSALESVLSKRGDLARAVLLTLSMDETLQPHIEMAKERSSTPHLLTGLEIAGAVAIVLFVAKVRRFRAGPVEIVFDTKNAAALVEHATELIDKLNPLGYETPYDRPKS